MKKITRRYLESLLNQKDWGEKGSDEREVALILICSAIVGAFISKIKKILGNPNGMLERVSRNAYKNKLWDKKGKVHGEWADKRNGGVAFACDIAVCLGLLNRK